MNIPAVSARLPQGTVRLADHSGENKSIIRIFAICILIWALDYKAASSGEAAGLQGAILGVFIIASFFLTIFSLQQRINAEPLWVLMLVTYRYSLSIHRLLDRAWDSLDMLFSLTSFLRLSTFALSVITFMTLRAVKDKNSFLDVLRLACVIFGAVHVLIVILTRGRDKYVGIQVRGTLQRYSPILSYYRYRPY